MRSSSLTVALSSSLWNKYLAALNDSNPEVLLKPGILGRIWDPNPEDGIE
jgi:hypothetical protein